jgi:hypothetical protein
MLGRMMKQTRWAGLFSDAAAQHGVVTASLARHHGINDAALRARARREAWRPVALTREHHLRAAYLLPGAAETYRARVAAVLLTLGHRTAASHATAAFLHDLDHEPEAVHVQVSADRSPRSRPGLLVTRAALFPADHVVTVSGLRATSPARTARDLARDLSFGEVLDLLTEMEQRRLVKLPQLEAMAAALPRGPGASRFAEAVAARQRDRSDSGLERDTAELCRRAGFPPHEGPFPVRHRDRRAIHLDVAFPAIRFAIECDGFGYHRSRSDFERDRRRWRTAMAAGWELTWVTRPRLLKEPEGIVAEVRAAHERAWAAR